MNWFLVISLFSTDDVLIRQFHDKTTCEKYKVEHTQEFKRDSDIKEFKCEEGSVVGAARELSI